MNRRKYTSLPGTRGPDPINEWFRGGKSAVQAALEEYPSGSLRRAAEYEHDLMMERGGEKLREKAKEVGVEGVRDFMQWKLDEQTEEKIKEEKREYKRNKDILEPYEEEEIRDAIDHWNDVRDWAGLKEMDVRMSRLERRGTRMRYSTVEEDAENLRHELRQRGYKDTDVPGIPTGDWVMEKGDRSVAYSHEHGDLQVHRGPKSKDFFVGDWKEALEWLEGGLTSRLCGRCREKNALPGETLRNVKNSLQTALRVARKLFREGKIEEYQLEALEDAAVAFDVRR